LQDRNQKLRRLRRKKILQNKRKIWPTEEIVIAWKVMADATWTTELIHKLRQLRLDLRAV
jgi:hypothetical protein